MAPQKQEAEHEAAVGSEPSTVHQQPKTESDIKSKSSASSVSSKPQDDKFIEHFLLLLSNVEHLVKCCDFVVFAPLIETDFSEMRPIYSSKQKTEGFICLHMHRSTAGAAAAAQEGLL